MKFFMYLLALSCNINFSLSSTDIAWIDNIVKKINMEFKWKMISIFMFDILNHDKVDNLISLKITQRFVGSRQISEIHRYKNILLYGWEKKYLDFTIMGKPGGGNLSIMYYNPFATKFFIEIWSRVMEAGLIKYSENLRRKSEFTDTDSVFRKVRDQHIFQRLLMVLVLGYFISFMARIFIFKINIYYLNLSFDSQIITYNNT